MKTAVEWLESELRKWSDGRYYLPSHLFEKAKQIESSQMDSEYRKGWEAAEEIISKEIDNVHEYYRSHRST